MRIFRRSFWGLGAIVLTGVIWEARIRENQGPLENAGAENIAYNVICLIGLVLLADGIWKTLAVAASTCVAKRNGPSTHAEGEQSQDPLPKDNTICAVNLYSDACREIGIAENSSPEQIKWHWRRSCSRWHPDHGGNHSTWIRKKAAYEMLLAYADYNREKDFGSPQ